MLFHSLLALLSFSSLVLSLPVIGFQIRDGVTSLLGNSFGVPGVNRSFDYVIVGGGTAGNTVAARLAQDPAGYSVAVIEAGSFYDLENGNRTQVPGYAFLGMHPETVKESLVEFDIVTQPQPGYNNRTIHYHVGRTFGGSSASNYMGYQRGTVGSFQRWADIVGDQSYTWDNIYPYYKKSANFTPPNFDKIGPGVDIPYDLEAFSSTGGPLQVSYGNYQWPYAGPLGDGLAKIGLKKIPGLNSGSLIGYAPITSTVDPKAGTRSTSETSFLQSAIESSTLTVYQSTMAKKILFDENREAVGVNVEAQGSQNWEYTLYANKEVIISAGTWHSPQLLMVSGIGPQATLEKFNIPVISVLEGVGQNIWDQPWFSLSYQLNVTGGSQLNTNPEFQAQAEEDYLTSQSGPLSAIGAGEVIGWEKIPQPNRGLLSNATLEFLAGFPSDWPELELLPLAVGPSPPNASITDNYVALGFGLMAPNSRGNMTISSVDTDVLPVISPNHLISVADQEVAVQAVLRVRAWAAASGVMVSEYLPGVDVQSNEEILEWLRENGSIIWHASASCAMGRDADPAAVLDSKARVRGVSGLRVVDASAFPILVPGHPVATVYMLAEKIADTILNED